MPTLLSIAFPFQKGATAFPAPAYDDDAIKASIIQIITTAKGERVMRPDFGCNAFSFVFENDTDEFRRFVEREVRSSLTKWETRIAINAVTVETGGGIVESGQMLITVYYTVISSGKSNNVSIAGGT